MKGGAPIETSLSASFRARQTAMSCTSPMTTSTIDPARRPGTKDVRPEDGVKMPPDLLQD
jgi:hypothetical protein